MMIFLYGMQPGAPQVSAPYDKPQLTSQNDRASKLDFHQQLESIQKRLVEIGMALNKIAEELAQIKIRLDEIGRKLQELQQALEKQAKPTQIKHLSLISGTPQNTKAPIQLALKDQRTVDFAYDAFGTACDIRIALWETLGDDQSLKVTKEGRIARGKDTITQNTLHDIGELVNAGFLLPEIRFEEALDLQESMKILQEILATLPEQIKIETIISYLINLGPPVVTITSEHLASFQSTIQQLLSLPDDEIISICESFIKQSLSEQADKVLDSIKLLNALKILLPEFKLIFPSIVENMLTKDAVISKKYVFEDIRALFILSFALKEMTMCERWTLLGKLKEALEGLPR